MYELKVNDLRGIYLKSRLASHTHVRVESEKLADALGLSVLASHTRIRVESADIANSALMVKVSLLTRAYELKASPMLTSLRNITSLLTRAYELKEPVCNPLILNVLDPSFREPVTFILYRLVLK